MTFDEWLKKFNALAYFNPNDPYIMTETLMREAFNAGQNAARQQDTELIRKLWTYADTQIRNDKEFRKYILERLKKANKKAPT